MADCFRVSRVRHSASIALFTTLGPCVESTFHDAFAHLSAPRNGQPAHIRESVYEASALLSSGPELNGRMAALQVRKETLMAQLASADAPLPLLHPSMAAEFPRQVDSLGGTLANANEHGAARDSLRGFIERIIIRPEMDCFRSSGISGRC